MKYMYAALPVILVFFLPSVAFAEDGGSSWIPILGDLLPLVVSSVLLPLIGWAVKLLSSYLSEKVKSDMLRKALIKLNTVVVGVVSALAQEMADEFKKAAEDGKLSESEKKQLKEIAFARIKTLLDLSTWGILVGEFSSEDKVEELISNQIEAVVRSTKEK